MSKQSKYGVVKNIIKVSSRNNCLSWQHNYQHFFNSAIFNTVPDVLFVYLTDICRNINNNKMVGYGVKINGKKKLNLKCRTII
jgi:hypothetical protein